VAGSPDDERWRPETALPRFHGFDRDEIARLEAYAASCTGPASTTEGPLKKAWAWERHRCEASPLPAAFFSEPPFMHPDGRSYAWHARACGAACSRTEDPESFHVLERAEIDAAAWPRLDRTTLRDIVTGEPFTSDAHTLFVRSGGRYSAIPISELTDAGSRFSRGNDRACDVKSFGRCWVDRERRSASRAWAGLLVAAGVLLGIALVALVIWRIRAGRALMNERLLVLRLLAHELRTPVTALKLEIEGVRSGFERLDAGHQARFLAMAGEVARLQRVVQASVVYLRSDSKKREAARQVDSLRDFLEGIGSDVADAPITIDAPDAVVALPLTSAALALRNVVRNAVEHGKPPVKIGAALEPREVVITVSDDGELPAHLVKSLGRAFVPSAGADGLGLGLYLASEALRSVGGKLTVTRAPTTFTLRIPRGEA
jgi:signal transduction histidine kinase